MLTEWACGKIKLHGISRIAVKCQFRFPKKDFLPYPAS
jgi:hypothetical protein